MKPFRLSRRTLLKGIGGITVALPALEAMVPARARAQTVTAPSRFVMMYGGTSQGADGNAPFVAPSAAGASYTPTRALAPLTTMGLQSDVAVIPGLKVPWDTGSGVPPGGRSVYYHFNTIGPQIAGTRTGSGRNAAPTKPTADQLVAGQIAGNTPFPVLALRIQAMDYDSNSNTMADDLAMSWRASGGGVQRVDPLFSPALAYQTLFSNFSAPNNAAQQQAAMLLARRKSVLDMVDWNTQRLIPRLGMADQQRIQQHFDEIRALEQRVAMTVTPTSSSCQAPANPGSDPALQPGYSGEAARAAAMVDLVHMAIACDLTRAVSLMVTQWKCYMQVQHLTGYGTDMHSLTHQSSVPGVSDSVAWHLGILCSLVKKLGATPEVDGKTLLDHTALVLLFEGGSGYDPEGGSSNGAHSTENMVVFAAGRVGGLMPGKHLIATGMHPANVVISAMNAVGVSGGLGDVSGNIPGLFI